MFTVYYADILGKSTNCSYPHKVEITGIESLKKSVSFDYVCAEYKDNYRNINNFIGSNCLPVDCDNDHSDNPSDWVTPDDVKEAFPDVSFAIHYSRNHNKDKGEKKARPKFHVLFPIDYITDPKAYSEIKRKVIEIFPYFDKNASDAARFFFGTENPVVEIIEGNINLTEFLKSDDEIERVFEMTRFDTSINEGSRNSTMSKYAGKIIKRYGDTPEAYDHFIEQSKRCSPPLEDNELKSIWCSAGNFYSETILKDKAYIPADQFNAVASFGANINWKQKLKYKQNSTIIENSVWNLMLILNNDPDLQGFGYNEFASQIQVTGSLPWDRPLGNKYWRDADTAQLKALIDVRYTPFSTRNHDVAFSKVTDDRRFHPVRDYLDGLPVWDGIERVDRLFIDTFQADDNEYVKAVTRKTFVAAVARIYEPGIKFDNTAVLDGAQGIGKSSIIRYLSGEEYFSDGLQLTDMDDKTAAEKLQGFWIVEIGELSGMKKADIDKVKSFISCTDDKYRASYGKTVESHPRQCIIIATVNGERGYLRDITGNRRFWIIKLHQEDQKLNFTNDDYFRDQFWAECIHYYKQGEKLYLEGELLNDAEEAQRGAMELDERLGMVIEYLNTLLPETWDEIDVYARRSFLQGGSLLKGVHQRTTVSNAEIWSECFGKNLSDLRASDSYSIAALMIQIDGWEKTTKISRIPIYGRQRLYTRS
jgi:predicted P-loop ATPase